MRHPRGWDWDAVARYSIILGAAIRAAWVLVLHSPLDHIYSDAKTYVDTAMHLAQLASPERFDAFYPPGTRVVLALPLALIGADRDGLTAGALLWTVLSAATPYFVWRYLRLLLSPVAAAIGAVLCALYPLHIAYAGFFTSETPGLAFLALSLWLTESTARSASSRRGLLAGLAGGFATAIRPAFALNVILAAIPLVRRVRISLRAVIAFAAGSILVLALVLAHEALVAGQVVGVSENGGVTFYLGHCDVRRITTGTPETLTYTFQTPIATQLERGRNVTFPDHPVWDQAFFYAQGARCIASDGIAHARVILRNIYDMGLSTVPWPPSNDEGLKQVAAFTNVGYVLLLPFIVFGALSEIRRVWPAGRSPGQLMLVGQLSLVLVTAVVYFGDPRFRIPFDVFGLALAASLIADRIGLPSLRQTPADPGVRAEDAVQEDDEGALVWAEPTREVDAYHARSAETDGDALIRAHNDAPDETRWREARRARADEELGLIGPDVHEIPPIGPEAVELERARDFEPSSWPEVGPVGTHAPNAGARDENAGGIAGRNGGPGEKEDPRPVEER